MKLLCPQHSNFGRMGSVLTLARTGGWCTPLPEVFSQITKKNGGATRTRRRVLWATLWGKPGAIFGKTI